MTEEIRGIEAARPERRQLIGVVAGVLLGMGDYVLLTLAEVRMIAAGRDVTFLVCTLFALSSGGMGYVIGRLLEARGRLRRSAGVIQSQLHALEASQRRLLQSEKLASIGQLASGIAHEVRNPLGVIRASTSMLLEDLPAGSDAHRAGAFIREEVDRLNRVVTALVSYARPLSPRLEAVRLEEVVAGALHLVDEELRRREIVVTVTDATALPPAQGDPDLLIQVVYGLLLNAAQTLEAGGRIEVRFGAADEGELWLEVADDGPGVPAEVGARVFEPFFTTREEGTGLGLAMAARIVEAHRGLIELRRAAGAGPGGAGACFRLALPEASLERGESGGRDIIGGPDPRSAREAR